VKGGPKTGWRQGDFYGYLYYFKQNSSQFFLSSARHPFSVWMCVQRSLLANLLVVRSSGRCERWRPPVLAFPWRLTLPPHLRIHPRPLFFSHAFRSIRNELCSGILLLVRTTATTRKSSKHLPLSLLLLLLLLLSVQRQDCRYFFLTSNDARRNEFHWRR